MPTTVLAIHGHGLKPTAETLSELWQAALGTSIGRSGKSARAAFDKASWKFVYFGDLFRPVLDPDASYDMVLDIEDRRHSLQQLSGRKKKSYESRRVYERLPGKNSLGEFIADVGQPALRSVGLGHLLIERYAPSFVSYWNELQTAVVDRVIAAIRETPSEDRLVVIAHCLGSVAAYDAFWRISHDADCEDLSSRKIDLWLTLGSPLGDETVKRRLLGAKQHQTTKFPKNVLHWANVTAEDDYISHDNTVANDFSAMLDNRFVSSIDDSSILNLAIRYGRSNPHNAIGYLIHPKVARTIATALER